MATPRPHPPYEPSACWRPFSTTIRGQHYLWRGYGKDRRSTSINVFDSYTETWSHHNTTGALPSGMCDGACTSIGTDIYTFGGSNGSTRFNDLRKFDSTNNVWTEIRCKNDEAHTPMKKTNSRLVSVNEKTLALFAGYGVGHTDCNSRFIKSSAFSDGRGWTNEFHLFDIEEG